MFCVNCWFCCLAMPLGFLSLYRGVLFVPCLCTSKYIIIIIIISSSISSIISIIMIY